MTADSAALHASCDYSAYGLRIASELSLPELVRMNDASQAPPDVTIELRPGIADAELPDQGLQVDGDDVLLTVEAVARYRVSGGRHISIEPCSAATERNIRVYLLGSAFAILFHQRRLLPLHATAIVVDGRAIAFTGRAGIGKSTLAAHFQARGYEVLCDDICVTSFDADGLPMAWPGPPHLKLWRDTAERFGHDCGKLQRVLDSRDKYRVPRGAASSGPFPLARIYALSDLAVDAIAHIGLLRGALAVEAVMKNTYRGKYLQAMGLVRSNLAQAASIARHARIYAAPRRRDIHQLHAEVTRLEHHVRLGDDGRPHDAAAFSGLKQEQAG